MTTMSPELVLVDPELRADAVARLPPIYVNSFLESRALPVERVATIRPSAALAYLALAIVRTCVFDAVVFASVATCVLLASMIA